MADTHLVDIAIPPLIITGMTKLEVAKGGKARVGLGGDGTLLNSINIEGEDTAIDDNGYMHPTGCGGEDIGYVESVCAVTLPPHRDGSIVVVMEKELTPSGTYLMSVANILGTAHPELDGSLTQHLGDGIGNGEATLGEGSEGICVVLRSLDCHRV